MPTYADAGCMHVDDDDLELRRYYKMPFTFNGNRHFICICHNRRMGETMVFPAVGKNNRYAVANWGALVTKRGGPETINEALVAFMDMHADKLEKHNGNKPDNS